MFSSSKWSLSFLARPDSLLWLADAAPAAVAPATAPAAIRGAALLDDLLKGFGDHCKCFWEGFCVEFCLFCAAFGFVS